MEKRSNEKSFSKIIELTPDKEVPGQRGGRIIDLTQALESTSRSTRTPSPQKSEPADTRPQALSPAAPSPQKPETDDAAPPALTRTAELRRKAAEIDDEVDKAFGLIQPVESWLDPVESDLPQSPAPAESNPPAQPAAPQDLTEDASPEEPLALEETPAAPEQEVAAIAEEEAIIDLTEIAVPEKIEEAAEDQEIIDLTDMVQVEASSAGQPAETEDELIELVDIIEPGMDANAADEIIDLVEQAEPGDHVADDEPIDLVDLVAPGDAEADDGMIDPEDVAARQENAEAADEGFIDLMDVVTAGAPDQSEAGEEIIDLVDIVPAEELALINAPQGDATPAEPSIEEVDLIELDRLLPTEDDLPESPPGQAEQVIQLDEHRKAEPSEPEIELAQEEDLFGEADAVDDNPLDVIGMELAETEPAARGLSPEALEAAIEKILYTKYADRIERLIAIAVEKAVTREIEQIKREFMDDVGLREDDDMP